MRITCPNCGAQYEVAADAIPPAGRDVQCSACSHVWLEGGEGPALPETAEPAPPEAKPETGTGAASQEEAEPQVEPAPQEEPEAQEEPAPLSVPPPHRPAIAPEVAAILREEAERERARREAERPAPPLIEIQPDLGLEAPADPVSQRAEEARRRIARIRAEAAPEPAAPPASAPEPGPAPGTAPESAPAAAPAPRRARDRLPDIEEINSSLRAATERAPAHVAEAAVAATEAARQGRGFRLGFSVVVAAAAIAAGVYAGAPRIAALVPAFQAPLQRYVAVVDEARLWLDLRLQALLPEDGAGGGAGD
ncbi:MAG: zinc-ribbon domain-containing protein [Rubellimicrobium sp.]|nr:zinc-ribbon domain-containing protein [Rubellimicrobium sp.]